MTVSFPDMTNEHITGYLLTAIGVLSTVIGVLWKGMLGDIVLLKKKVPELEERLDKEIAERHKSDLKALRAEIEGKMPCHLEACPRRHTFSVTEDPA